MLETQLIAAFPQARIVCVQQQITAEPKNTVSSGLCLHLTLCEPDGLNLRRPAASFFSRGRNFGSLCVFVLLQAESIRLELTAAEMALHPFLRRAVHYS